MKSTARCFFPSASCEVDVWSASGSVSLAPRGEVGRHLVASLRIELGGQSLPEPVGEEVKVALLADDCSGYQQPANGQGEWHADSDVVSAVNISPVPRRGPRPWAASS